VPHPTSPEPYVPRARAVSPSRNRLRTVEVLRPAPGIVSVLQGEQNPQSLTPEEQRLCDTLPKGRRPDFVVGRRAACAAIGLLGRSGPVLRDGPRPLFPDGVRGSISHHRGRIAAAAASVRADIAGIGVDVERCRRVTPESARLVCTPNEYGTLSDRGIELFTVAFSAKESVYKAIAATAIARPTYHDIQVDVQGTSLAIEVASGLLPEECHVTGRVHTIDPYVWTTVLLWRTP